MRHVLKAALTGLGAMLLVTGAAAAARAACGDLNNDGSVTLTDAAILSLCVVDPGNAQCTASCGGLGVATCGNVREETPAAVTGLDVAVLVNSLAGLGSLYDLCEGPGATVAAGGSNAGSCPGTMTLGSQTITASQKWPAGCTIELNGTVLVDTLPGQPTTVVTIDPGVTIKGVVGSPQPATVIFLPGTKIDAQGTHTSPIVFTSSNAPGARTKGDWAGVMFNGRSTVNRPNCLNNSEGIPAAYGGCNPADDSGVAKYVRVEYCGLEFTPNNELNAWTMNALGNRTNFSFIQANVGQDDCLEWFGGTINTHHMVASACGDDGFDWQLGYTGALQYGLQIQAASIMDQARDSRAIEADNSEFGNDDKPVSNPDYCNLTMVGARVAEKGTCLDGTRAGLACDDLTDCTGGGTVCTGLRTGSDSGMVLRRGTAGTIANSIVTGYFDGGIEMRDAKTTERACLNDTTLNTAEPLLRLVSDIVINNGDTVAKCTVPGQCSVTAIACLTARECPAAETCTAPAPVVSSSLCEADADCVGVGQICPAARENCQTSDITGGPKCQTCRWYQALGVANTGNTAQAIGNPFANDPGVSTSYPTAGNVYDTTIGTPAVVTGLIGGQGPADCTTFNGALEANGYRGAFDPTGADDIQGDGDSWLSSTWNNFDIN